MYALRFFFLMIKLKTHFSPLNGKPACQQQDAGRKNNIQQKSRPGFPKRGEDGDAQCDSFIVRFREVAFRFHPECIFARIKIGIGDDSLLTIGSKPFLVEPFQHIYELILQRLDGTQRSKPYRKYILIIGQCNGFRFCKSLI